MCHISELVGKQIIVKGEKVQFLVEGILTEFPGMAEYCVEGPAPDHVVFSGADVLFASNGTYPIVTLY